MIKIKTSAFLLAGLLGMILDWSHQLELLFQVEMAIIRGLMALWIIELAARLGRAVVDALSSESPTGTELSDRLTSALASGTGLYILLAAWVGGSAILSSSFNKQPYSMLGAFLKTGSAFTAALWLFVNVLTFLAGSREKASAFLQTSKRLFLRIEEGRVEDAPEPVEEYH